MDRPCQSTRKSEFKNSPKLDGSTLLTPDLYKLDRLIDGTPITVELHPTLNYCQCVVSCNNVEKLSNEELQTYLADQGIVKVYRFIRKQGKKDIPTSSMVLTIRGSAPPPYVFFGFIRVATRTYYPRPLLCYNCGTYGHTKNRCKNETICLDCGNSCDRKEKCLNQPHCINCGSNHPAIDRNCPLYIDEQAIIRLRIDRGISQAEATREYRNRVTNQQLSRPLQQSNSDAKKDQRIRELEAQIALLTKQLAKFNDRAEEINDITLVKDSSTSQDSEESNSDSDNQSTIEAIPSTSTPKRNRQNSSYGSPPGTATSPRKKRQPFTATQPPIITQGNPSPIHPGASGYQLHTASDPNSRQGAGLAIKNGIPYCDTGHIYIDELVSYQSFSSEIEDLLSQLPIPLFIMTDPNAHSTTWGSSHTTKKGNFIENLAQLKNLTVLNNSDPTRIDPATGNLSALDLTLASWELGPKLDWAVLEDSFGSDHFPILIKLQHPTPKVATRPRWKYDEADWQGFQLEVDHLIATTEPVLFVPFAKIPSDAGKNFIPRTSGAVGKTAVPWWNPEVQEAVKHRRKKLRALRRIPNNDPGKQLALEEFKKARSLARSTVRTAKANSWQKFTEEIHPSTSSNVLWEKLKRLNGEPRKDSYRPLLNQRHINNPSTLADSFCEHFSSISMPHPQSTITLASNDTTSNNQEYNKEFSLAELEFCLRKASGYSAGPDDLGYPFFKNLSLLGKLTLLKIFNKIWIEGGIPECWKLGLVTPIAKHKQNPLLLDNYRPITLLDCAGKILERMVNRRLHGVLEKETLIDNRQFGFRPGRSTDDYFELLERTLDTSLSNHRHVECLSLDLSKAFDRVDRTAILNTFTKWGIQGRMLRYVQDFLSDRYIQVLINDTRSNIRPVICGVPQGSVIVPTLFLVAMNSIFQVIPNDIQITTYADDILLLSISSFPKTTRRKLQRAVNIVADWAPSMGFQISPKKSSLLHFGPNRRRLGRLHPLLMNSQKIPLVHSTRLLGVWLDDRLNFKLHFNNVRKNATNKMNILRILSNHTSMAHRDSLFRFLHGWLLPSVLYGLHFISRAKVDLINKLEPLYNQGVRTISSAYHTSPITSLIAESYQEPFTYLVARWLSTKAIRALANGEPKESPSIMRTDSLLYDLTDQNLPPICPRQNPCTRPWNEAGDHPNIILPHFMELTAQKYKTHPHVYTDGSKTDSGKAGCGIYSGNNIQNKSLPLPPECSVFSCEAYAILEATQSVEPSSIIFSDSASVLNALSAGNTKHPWIPQISKIALRRNITLCWVPGHAGIPGNEAADRLAAAATKLDPPNIPIPQQDASKFVRNLLQLSWSIKWDLNHESKLREVKNSTEKWIDRKNNIERRALTRLRIGHTNITHQHLLKKEDPPNCSSCNVPITVKHILVTCQQYNVQRTQSHLANNLREILSNCPNEEKKILVFLRNTKLLHQL
ncbi:uncharacterized protein LOC129753347 [Uranotaenia lowii]|uniref:uncharacterized protein LOC129753347 n=1 Tax=Uranotaenia lowii TaxID=190385 RepID=UPI002479BAD7|nr:uncharacterized protein LOC129753347 [Uranotaenia lowii]